MEDSLDYIEISRLPECSIEIMIPFGKMERKREKQRVSEQAREREREHQVQSILNKSRSTAFLLFTLILFYFNILCLWTAFVRKKADGTKQAHFEYISTIMQEILLII